MPSFLEAVAYMEGVADALTARDLRRPEGARTGAPDAPPTPSRITLPYDFPEPCPHETSTVYDLVEQVMTFEEERASGVRLCLRSPSTELLALTGTDREAVEQSAGDEDLASER